MMCTPLERLTVPSDGPAVLAVLPYSVERMRLHTARHFAPLGEVDSPADSPAVVVAVPYSVDRVRYVSRLRRVDFCSPTTAERLSGAGAEGANRRRCPSHHAFSGSS